MSPFSINTTRMYQTIVSIVFGLIGFWLNFLDIQLLSSATFKVSILPGLFFPLLIAHAWGWRYGLLTALAGGCQSMWWLWSGDGWGVFYSVPIFILWIVWHGYWADKRRYMEYSKWYFSEFAIEIPFRLIGIVGFFTLFRWLVSFNPPPWSPEITWDFVAFSWVNTVVIKHIITAYILLLATHVCLSLGPVRSFFRLPSRRAEQDVTAIYAGAFLVGFSIWFLDSLCEYLFFYSGEGFWDLLALEVGPHTVFMRVLYMLVPLFSAVLISSLVRHRALLFDRIRHINRILSAIRDVNQLITHEKDYPVLLNEACRLLVQRGGFKSAWIVLQENEVPTEYYHSGFGESFQPMAQLLQEGSLPFCGWNVLENGGVYVVEDPLRQCPACPLAQCNNNYSSLTTRLEHRERVYGWVSVCIPREMARDEEEQGLFTEVVQDIAYALWALEIETEKEATSREYSAVLNATSDAVIAMDMQGKLTLFNPGAEKLYNCSREEALGQSVKCFCPQDLWEEQEERMRLVRTYSMALEAYETERLTIDGHRLPVEVSLSLLVNADGEPSGYSAILRDITERKRAEKELARLNTALRAKNSELEQVVYVASHDLRTPLVNIDGYGKELSYSVRELQEVLPEYLSPDALERVQPLLSEDIPEALRFIQASASKMDRLLSGLLRLSRTGRASLNIESLEMNELIRNVLEVMEFQTKKAQVELEVLELPPCEGDAIQVNQVFTNLVSNALKYLHPERQGKIRISGEVHGKDCIYCVEDNGLGIDSAHQKSIFEIFHRLNPDEGEGEGLGLTIVRRIMDRLDGAVWVESEPGYWSRFYIKLPGAKDTE